MATYPQVQITQGAGTGMATVLPGTTPNGNQQIVSIGDPNNGGQQLAVNASGEASVNAANGSIVTLGSKADAAATNTDTTAVSVVSLLKGLFLRLIVGTNDAVARSALGMLLQGGVNPSGTVDARRTLAASGYGLGTALVSGAELDTAVSVGFASLSGGGVNAWTAQAETGIKKRTITIKNGTDQSVNVYFYLKAGGASAANGFIQAFGITVVATGLVVITSAGMSAQVGGAPTIVQGAAAMIDGPAYQTQCFVVKTGTAPASGNVTIDYTATT